MIVGDGNTSRVREALHIVRKEGGHMKVVVLTNADNGQKLIDEIINNVATVYECRGLYEPIEKKLVTVTDSVLNKYVGDYFTGDRKMKIKVEKPGNVLQLTARRPEKNVCCCPGYFFLLSSPAGNCIFSGGSGMMV